MMDNRENKVGHTLIEVVIASAVLVAVVGTALAAFGYMLRMSNARNVQDELDINVQVAMERLKADLRLSALDRMCFNPAGNGPYVAISFPAARDDDGNGAVEIDANRDVIWDQTIIYHVWPGTPHELRVTTFDPRDESLTIEQRQQQLDAVVAKGNGSTTHNARNARTVVIFRNVFSWQLTTFGALFDAYSPTPESALDISMGFAQLTPGNHTFTFTAVDKHVRSSGYDLGIDTLVVSPSYGVREAEAQLPATANVGPTPEDRAIVGGSVSGHHRLVAPLEEVGQFFTLTMNNDQWEETNFSDPLADSSNIVAELDESLTPSDVIARLEGNEVTWSAADSSGDTLGASGGADAVNGSAVRVLLRGEDMLNGMNLQCSGARCSVNFRAASLPNERLRIDHAFIMECLSPDIPTPDAVGSTITRLTFSGNDDAEILSGQQIWSDWATFPIDKDKSYLVSYLVNKKKENGPAWGSAWTWGEPCTPTNGSAWTWIASDTPEEAEAKKDKWSDKINDKVFRTNTLFGVQAAAVTYLPGGQFESQGFDTRLTAPLYGRMDWNAIVPSGCVLTMKVRTGSNSTMSDAPDWSSVPAMSSPSIIAPGSGRYIQFLAILASDSTTSLSPKLKDVTITWQGETRVVDMQATFAKSPTSGIYEMRVDGARLVTGITVELQIFKEARGTGGNRQLTSGLIAEVRPLNTRK